jgi:hypothetical protein
VCARKVLDAKNRTLTFRLSGFQMKKRTGIGIMSPYLPRITPTNGELFVDGPLLLPSRDGRASSRSE